MPTRICKYQDKSFCALDHEPEDLECVKCIQKNPGEYEKTSKDVITRPSHYISGRKYEPKDVIRDWGLNFNLGSAVKYISRAGRKDNIIQDLEKARTFIDFEIDALKEEQNGKRI